MPENSACPKPGLNKVIFPQVLSASRATDLPSFHVDWLMDRLRAGYCLWQNPFNAAQTQHVSFAKVRAIVFWSKNPAPLIPHLAEICDMGLKFYFQYTINNYQAERLETGLPPLEERIRTFCSLAGEYPVIWRYDPVIYGPGLDVKQHMRIIRQLMRILGDRTEKLVFSFLDLYTRVERNLKKFTLRAPDQEEMRIFCQELLDMREKLAPRLRLASCAEACIDIPGIEKNSCIDPVLLNRLCQYDIFTSVSGLLGKSFPRDNGQRKACNCAPSKDIGSYHIHVCQHRCLYCYAGHASRKYVDNSQSRVFK